MARQQNARSISKKRKFVRDGVFFTELNEFFDKELADDGYTGCNVRVTPIRTEIVIRTTHLEKVAGKEERRIRELTALVQKRFDFKPGSLICIAGTLKDQSLSALVQAQAVKFKLLEGLSVRRAAYSVLKFIKDKGAKGCEVVVSGKLRGQRAKSMKFREGYMIHAGDAVNYYIDEAVKHVHLRQGVLGIKVKLMLPSASDSRDGEGVAQELPDKIVLPEAKPLPADTMLRRQIQERELAALRAADETEQQMEFQEQYGAEAPAGVVGVPEPAAAGGYPPEEYGAPPAGGYAAPEEAPAAGYGAAQQPPADASYGQEFGAPAAGGPPAAGYDQYYPPQQGYGAGAASGAPPPPAERGFQAPPAERGGFQGGPPPPAAGGYGGDFSQY